MDTSALQALRPFLDELADAAAGVTLPLFRTGLGVENKVKGAFDPVTIADRNAEQAMRALIDARQPSHGVIGEEFGASRPDAALQWVLDPVDGTRSFICGIPLWGTLIGLMENGRPILGCMDQPFTGERFVGDTLTASLRTRFATHALRVRACASLAEASLMSTTPTMFRGSEVQAFERLTARARLTRYGADCYAYCMVAAGCVDLVVESGLQLYDVAALAPIVQGAGGLFTDWQGGTDYASGKVIAAGDARVHAEALALLAGR